MIRQMLTYLAYGAFWFCVTGIAVALMLQLWLAAPFLLVASVLFVGSGTMLDPKLERDDAEDVRHG